MFKNPGFQENISKIRGFGRLFSKIRGFGRLFSNIRGFVQKSGDLFRNPGIRSEIRGFSLVNAPLPPQASTRANQHYKYQNMNFESNRLMAMSS
jgi:hypothetical protein